MRDDEKRFSFLPFAQNDTFASPVGDEVSSKKEWVVRDFLSVPDIFLMTEKLHVYYMKQTKHLTIDVV